MKINYRILRERTVRMSKKCPIRGCKSGLEPTEEFWFWNRRKSGVAICPACRIKLDEYVGDWVDRLQIISKGCFEYDYVRSVFDEDADE